MATPCPDPETFGRWLADAVEPALRAEIADHAAECTSCHRLIDAWCPPTADAATGTLAAAQVAPGGEPAPGAQVDRYRIVRRLGAGGMGVVYAALDPELGRDVAIKLVRPGAPIDRFAREAQALARLSHPNVVAVHDVGVHDGRTFIAMALVDGLDLRRWLQDPHPADEIVEVIRAAGAGIAAAHAAGLVHRDLKPDNIFVASDGRVLVGDFGLARELASGELDAPASGDALALATPLTGTGTVLGTPAYMAPEQARGEATEASDQFSLCVTAWEALYGVRPFAGGTLRTILERVKAGRITRPAGVRVPARIERALRRGLAHDPDARFATVGELCAALGPRRRVWPWLAAGVVVAAGAGVAIAMLSRGGAPIAAPDCDAPVRALDDVWNAGAKDAIARALAAAPRVTAPGAQPVPVVAELDAYATRWRTARRAVCEAAARGEERAETTEERVACLDGRRAAIARVIERARGAGADPPDSIETWRAVEALPDAGACATLVASSAAVPPEKRAQVAALDGELDDLTMRHAGTSTTVPADAAALRARAEALGDAPLFARALSLEAFFAIDDADYPGGEAIARHAIRVAEDAHDDVGRAHAANILALALVDQGRVDEARGALDTADGALARGGGNADVETDLVRARAIVTDAAGDAAGAAAILRKRVDGLRARLGDDSVMVAEAWLDLGQEYSHANDEARSAEALRAGQEIFARHGSALATPEELALGGVQALQAGDFARAIELDDRARAAAREAKYGERALAAIALDSGGAYEAAGRWREGKAAYTEAQQLFERIPAGLRDLDGYAQALLGVGTMRLELGDAAGAIAPLRAAIASDLGLGAPAADDLSLTRMILGHALVATGAMHEARALLEPTLRALRDATPRRPQRTGSTAFYLAQAMWEDGDAHDRERALALAGDAERDLAQAIADATGRPMMSVARRTLEARLHALEAWRARHR